MNNIFFSIIPCFYKLKVINTDYTQYKLNLKYVNKIILKRIHRF